MSFVIVAGVAVVFLPSGMKKSGTQSMPTGDWGQITGWVADTAGYPGSVVVGTTKNGLKALADKTSAKVLAAIPFTDATTGFGGATQLQARLRVNSKIVATIDPPVEGPSGTLSVSATVDIAAGDVVTVEALASVSPGGVEGTISAGGYVRIT
ncbi:hypothetical protein ACFYO1_22945 [Nocardia sp. NPDC006044]|uniref:hypothetical protein n=1 Tax=Nocardia sp. NPDC006044 TaxID=3364306 RepID=UPI0036C5F7FD